jgi:hypothetical protein
MQLVWTKMIYLKAANQNRLHKKVDYVVLYVCSMFVINKLEFY